MIRIFIDTSVLLAACISKSGSSSYIMMLTRKGKIKSYISRYVIYEAKLKSAILLTHQMKQRLNFLLLQGKLIITEEPSDIEIQKCIKFIEKKDAPILAAAKKKNTEYVVTLDKKDFMQPKVREFMKPIKITTPKKFLIIEKLL